MLSKMMYDHGLSIQSLDTMQDHILKQLAEECGIQTMNKSKVIWNFLFKRKKSNNRLSEILVFESL